MARVITFSRVFPATHPRKGEPTYFIEGIWKSLKDKGYGHAAFHFAEYTALTRLIDPIVYDTCKPKKHTIRKGKRWKTGDVFSPRVWSGEPYRSKMLTIAPDITLERVVDISINKGLVKIGDSFIRPKFLCNILAMNDGLEISDFNYWFGDKPFEGQILIWQNDITSY